MRIRNKILIYLATTVVLFLAGSFVIIYVLFAEYREEEFQQHQFEKIKNTIWLISKFQAQSAAISRLLDEQDINDFYDEKLLVYDRDKQLIFDSLDSLHIEGAQEILNGLSTRQPWIETKEGDYDVVGVFINDGQNSRYAISKAYDAFGYFKLNYLRNTLIAIFLFNVVVVFVVSLYISNKISKPLTDLAEELSRYDLTQETSLSSVRVDTTSRELQGLTERFNELLERTNEAFTFQKHTVNHISHQLKTPVAILVSELEKLSTYSDIEQVKAETSGLVLKAKSLGDIINVLLQISKVESGQKLDMQPCRIDELVFNAISELNAIYPEFKFDVNYWPAQFDDKMLVVKTHPALMQQAFLNVLTNSITYNNRRETVVEIDGADAEKLLIRVVSSGEALSGDDEKYLFSLFYRGGNSAGKAGAGLGLVLAEKIVTLTEAKIRYYHTSEKGNVFEFEFA